MVKYTEEIRAFIYENYKGVGPKAMAELLNERFGTSFSHSQIKGYYANHKLNSGLTGRFEKGHLTHNKGMKGVCAKGCERTWFREGHLPHNTKPVGYERVTRDGYTEVKVAMRPSRKDCNDNFVLKHRLIWEQVNGPIPKGYVVTFKDGDKTNCSIDNLALVSFAENQQLTRRKLRSNVPEITETGILLARADIATRKRRKAKNNENT